MAAIREIRARRVARADSVRNVRVRLIGVDAPETWTRRDCFGAEAARALRRLAPPGSTLRAEGDVEPYDRYRRRLLYLWTARGAFVNATLIRTGYARAMVVPPDTRYAATFRTAEHDARHDHTGLWTTCPEPTARALTTPADSPPTTPSVVS
jgi:micrococcal nuclease